ncbi:MAG: endonuclease/exonuclease/phosphatase family protein, partial [Clostridia bacterium]|nr:endonuclease/exonuclease/phosphatase family protein [Clostridia bacterium]
MKITVASYNIMHAGMVDYDMKRLVQSILACDADIIGIQEVDVNAKRSGGRDIAAMLGQALGFESKFTPAIDFQGGQYGTTILSRYPITSFVYYPLESGTYEKRSI